MQKIQAPFFEKRDMMLTLIFLRLIGEKFDDGIENLKKELVARGMDINDPNVKAAFIDDPTFTDGTFYLPEESRWSTIINTSASGLNVALDTALRSLSNSSEQLKGCFIEGTFTTRNLAPNDIKQIVDEVTKITHKQFGMQIDLIGYVYEYFLKEFAVNATKEEMYNYLGGVKNDERSDKLDVAFKQPESNLRLVIVVDMWITGFSVDTLTYMYNDKPLQKHGLIQTISRVNRKYPGKEFGLIIDYIGIRDNMLEAMKVYGGGQGGKGPSDDDIEQAAEILRENLEIIKSLFKEFDLAPFIDTNTTDIQRYKLLNLAAEYVYKSTEESSFLHRRLEILRKLQPTRLLQTQHFRLKTSLKI